MAALPVFLDAHGTAIRVIACAVVLCSFAFVMASVVIDRRQRRSAARFHAKFVRPAETRRDRRPF